MVVPVGPAEAQALTVVEKAINGTISHQEVLPVRFTQLEVA
jgi:protein-L-isoaspartate O-methyltransferase